MHLHFLLDKMSKPSNMFGSIMLDWILCNSDCGLVVTIDDDIRLHK